MLASGIKFDYDFSFPMESRGYWEGTGRGVDSGVESSGAGDGRAIGTINHCSYDCARVTTQQLTTLIRLSAIAERDETRRAEDVDRFNVN